MLLCHANSPTAQAQAEVKKGVASGKALRREEWNYFLSLNFLSDRRSDR